MVVETPPKPEMGDIAFPLFPFARALKKAPPLIAREVVARIAAMRSAARGQSVVPRPRRARPWPPAPT